MRSQLQWGSLMLALSACGHPGPTNDGGDTPDARADAAAAHDAAEDGPRADGAPPTDAGSTTDAGGAPDAAPPADGGLPMGLVFDDEFDGPAGSAPDPTRWNVVHTDDGQWNHELECYVDSRDNVRLDGMGHLQLVARRAPGTVCEHRTLDITSGKVTTLGLFSHEHGRLEMRAMLPNASGMWPAFWAMGDNMPTVSWPQCGEIDVVEVVGQTPHTVYGTLHGPRADGSAWSHGKQSDTGLDLSAAFHTYSVTWTAGTISFEFDGVSYGSVDRSVLAANETWSFDTTGFFLLLNLAVGGDWPGPPAASTTFPQTMTIDYVRVYQ